MKLSDQISIVTGGSRGIGKAIAIKLAEAGSDVVITYRERAGEASEVVSMIQEIGRRAIAVKTDIGNLRDVRDLKNEVLRQFGTVDILINNAGAIIRPGGWQEISEPAIARTIDVNLKGTIYCIQEFAPILIEKRAGRIINLASTYGMMGAAPVLAYTAAKAGICSITYSMARELGKYNITVNGVAPGNIDTDMTKDAGSDVKSWAISTTPLGRLGTPAEVSEAVLFLILSQFITGHILVVDGGQMLNI